MPEQSTQVRREHGAARRRVGTGVQEMRRLPALNRVVVAGLGHETK